MNIVVVLPYICLLLLVILVVTQIFVPVLKGRPTWPLFRRESRLLSALQRKAQEQHEEHLVDQLTKKE